MAANRREKVRNRGAYSGTPGTFKNLSKSASRVLDVLEYFGIERRPLRAKEIARAFNLHPSSADQLLKTIVCSGYLTFDPIVKIYYPSPRLNRFAIWLTSDCFWSTDIAPLLEEIKARTQASVALSVRSENAMRIVDVVTVETPAHHDVLMPLDGVPGQAFLATCDDKVAQKIVDRAALFRQLPRGSSERLMARVRAVRSAGYAAGRSRMPPLWAVAIALPLRSAAPDQSVILGLAGAEEAIRPREDEIVEILRQTSQEHQNRGAFS